MSGLVRRVLAMARRYWPHLAVILLLDLLATPLALLAPLPLKLAVDHVVGSAPLPSFLDAVVPESVRSSRIGLLGLAAALQIGILLLVHLRDIAWYVLRARASEGVTLAFRERLFRHAQRLSLSFHDTRGTADSIYRIQWDAPGIQWLTIDGFIPFISAGVMLTGMLVVIAQIDGRLALVAMAVVPVLLVLSRAYDRRTRHRYRDVRELETRALGVIQEVLGSLRVVKAFGREESEQERFVRHSAASVRARVGLSVTEGAFGFAINLTTAIGTAVILFLGISSVLAGTMTLGALLIVLAYIAQLYRPLETLSRQVIRLQESMASVRRAFELLDETPDVKEDPNPRPLARARGAFELRHVGFRYAGHQVLRDISFRLEAGTRIGIVGTTGAGKTTLASLLTRFYDASEGEILLDGVDIRRYRLADVRAQFAVVLQDPVLFSTTIAENIGYGRIGARVEEIVAAARAANAHDFITRLPDGYDTVVGERGMTLSGGEKQRLSIARAFLKDAPILILDEPTSALDAGTEAALLDALDQLMTGRTTLIIAHRLSTLRAVDRILVIDGGTVIEDGPHAELVARGGAYARAARGSR